MMRTVIRTGVFAALMVGLAVPASAQVVHSLSFGLGLFSPRSFDSRVAGDVWVADLTQPEVSPGITGSLDFDFSRGSLDDDIHQFRAMPIFGEWHIGFGDHVEVGFGVGYQSKRVESSYLDLVNGHGTVSTADDTEILQTLRLRVIPVTGVVRFLAGHPGNFQPYVGAGVAAVRFRYSEAGDFVDTSDFSVFNDRFVATGTATGGLVLGGFRMPLGGDVYALNLEGRYLWANGNTGGFPNFLGDKIDLGGGSINFSFMIRY